MATGMYRDETGVDYLVLSHHDQDMKVSTKKVTMRATPLVKREQVYRHG